jgi:hypothetical protein
MSLLLILIVLIALVIIQLLVSQVGKGSRAVNVVG